MGREAFRSGYRAGRCLADTRSCPQGRRPVKRIAVVAGAVICVVGLVSAGLAVASRQGGIAKQQAVNVVSVPRSGGNSGLTFEVEIPVT
jgi:hypothetical protein